MRNAKRRSFTFVVIYGSTNCPGCTAAYASMPKHGVGTVAEPHGVTRRAPSNGGTIERKKVRHAEVARVRDKTAVKMKRSVCLRSTGNVSATRCREMRNLRGKTMTRRKPHVRKQNARKTRVKRCPAQGMCCDDDASIKPQMMCRRQVRGKMRKIGNKERQRGARRCLTTRRVNARAM